MQIGVVIVTYNRLEKLKTTLEKFSEQSVLPFYVLIVNNASTDGTANYLMEWTQKEEKYLKIVISNKQNLGGSGGFYVGLSKALQLSADWIWVSDDDAYPNKNAIFYAERFLTKHKEKYAAICGAVYMNGKIDISHRRNLIKQGLRLKEKQVLESEYKKEYFVINEFSYVGSIISKEAMLEVGVTKKDYFLHYDDTEHSLRLSKYGRIVCVPDIKIEHDILLTQDSKNKKYNVSWQKYYDYRNLLDMYRSVCGKKYYLFQYMIYKMKALFYFMLGMSKKEREILIAALTDAKENRLGIHDIYKPGYRG